MIGRLLTHARHCREHSRKLAAEYRTRCAIILKNNPDLDTDLFKACASEAWLLSVGTQALPKLLHLLFALGGSCGSVSLVFSNSPIALGNGVFHAIHYEGLTARAYLLLRGCCGKSGFSIRPARLQTPRTPGYVKSLPWGRPEW